jgi:hypothetical protein
MKSNETFKRRMTEKERAERGKAALSGEERKAKK